MNPIEISFIGAGNVAWHLSRKWMDKGLKIRQVFSRSREKANELANVVGANWTTDLSKIQPVDVFVIAVRDDAIGTVAEQLRRVLPVNSLVVHTSGATSGEVLKQYFPRCGVFYPLQSFSKNKEPVWREIPICVDAAESKDLQFLKKLGKKLSPHVFRIDDEERAVLHVAAVFANNFTNHLYHISAEILKEKHLPFDLLRPLILETARKTQIVDPVNVQTGPAIRGDAETMRRHLDYLEKYPRYRQLYQLLSESIANTKIA